MSNHRNSPVRPQVFIYPNELDAEIDEGLPAEGGDLDEGKEAAEADGAEDFQSVKGKKAPRQPPAEEIEEHYRSGDLPYRFWCRR